MKIALLCTAVAAGLFLLPASLSKKKDAPNILSQPGGSTYVCIPCGYECDTILYKTPGTCSHCKMELVKQSSIHFKNIKPVQLCSFIADAGDKNVLLLDVRTPAEFDGKAEEKFGRLKNAVNIPVQELEARIKELAAFKNRQIVVYCSHSHRSPRASYILGKYGFKKVTNMLGGMSVWPAADTDAACNDKVFVKQ
jgi:rhodanese-related sulfurtransferase/DNA-directed RNA polymerase subunit RPC12/RpoP